MPPTVQTLDELYGSINSLYNPQRQQINTQIGQTQQGGQAEEQGLMATQRQAFDDISQMASNKGMLFSGFSPDQQAKYNSTKFMPALASLRGKVQDNIARLQSALVGLDTDQRREAMTMQGKQQDRLFSYQGEQDRRKWEQEQSQTAYAREMEKLRQSQAFERSMIQQKSAADAPGKPGTDFLSYLSDQFGRAGGQGNRNITRQQQDQWANQWFLDQGIMDPAARQYFWDLFNTTYKRSSDPAKDWRYKR